MQLRIHKRGAVVQVKVLGVFAMIDEVSIVIRL